MSDAGSPFLKQDDKQDWNSFIAWDEWRKPETYRERVTPSEYSQRLKIETFRYRWYQRNNTLGRALEVVARAGFWAFLAGIWVLVVLKVYLIFRGMF